MNEPLLRQIRVGCALEHAFHTFTARMDLWWPAGHRSARGARMRLEGEPGGRFYEELPEGTQRDLGAVVRWEPPTRITYTWLPGSNGTPTEVDVRFVADGDGTLVEVRHAEGMSGLGDEWPQRVVRFDNAWTHVLSAFAQFGSRA